MMIFTDDEIETIKALILECGSDCPDVNWDKRQALGEKLGCLDPIPEPTEEELQRRKEFRESPTGVMLTGMFSRCVNYAARDLIEQQADFNFARDVFWGTKEIKPGDVLRIKLPEKE